MQEEQALNASLFKCCIYGIFRYRNTNQSGGIEIVKETYQGDCKSRALLTTDDRWKHFDRSFCYIMNGKPNRLKPGLLKFPLIYDYLVIH